MSKKLPSGFGLAGFAVAALSGAVAFGGNVSALTLTEDTTLTGDITDGIVVEAGSTVVLNLGGYNVTNVDGKSAIINRGTLTIMDNGNPEKGGIVSASSANTAAVTNYPDAVMTISGGTYTSDKWYIIRNYGDMTINGGTTVTAHAATTSNASMVTNGWVGGSDANNGDSIKANSGEKEPYLLINGGEFTAGLSNCSVIKNDDYSNLLIRGGTFRQPNGSLANCDSVVLNWNVAEIAGGTFYSENGPVISNGAYTGTSDKGQITITGGTFTIGEGGSVLGYGNDGWNNATGLMTITGGEFSTAVSAMPVNPRAANNGKFYELEVSGGNFGTNFTDTSVIKEGHVAVVSNDGGFDVINPEELDPAEEIGTRQTEDGEVNIVMPKAVDYSEAEAIEAADVSEDAVSGHIRFEDEFIGDRISTLVMIQTDADELTVDATKGGDLFGAFDIEMTDRYGETIDVKDTVVRVFIDLPEEVYEELAAYDKVEVVYFEDGEEVERLAAEIVADEDLITGEPYYYLTFVTTHFSTYGVVGVNEAAAPDTGAATSEAGSSVNYTGLIAAVTVMTAIVVIAEIVKFAKRK